jgi:hypothetical protein
MPKTKQPYTPCRLYIDGAQGIAVGDYITTSGGSAYMVQSLRVSPSRPERRYMQCLRWPIEKVPADARRFQLSWYRR